MVSLGNGKGVVIAKYLNQATMDAATGRASQAFNQMITAGAIDEDSIHAHTEDVLKSF